MHLLRLVSIYSQLLLCSATTLPLIRRSYNGTTSPMISTEFGTVFDVEVTVGNQSFQLLVDTGSSDTYVMKTGFQCINATNNLEIPEADCLYSPKAYNISDTYRKIPDQIFGIEYGAGIASGVMAYEDVTLGGITVKNQKVGIADRSNPMGDGVNSGLLGLGYPALTSAHPSNTSNSSYWYDRIVYNPLFTNMYEQGLVAPYFSLALARTAQNSSTGFGGYLSLGTLPPVPHSDFSIVPVEILDNIPLNYTSGKRVRSYWALTVSGATYGSSTNSTPFQAFVDSGNYISYLPSAIANSVNALFEPPARYDASLGAYVVDCTAKAPSFGLQIGNQTFFHNGADMIYQTGEGICISSVAASENVGIEGLTLNIIGVPFLKNVVAVFDFGWNEMRFAKLK
ncbi:hypothetical protein ASPWEDRAFT_60820 [Aspergillus wentii DTO 134E9]|uniref:Peptidase A1 domain-containing protein n=1 Tax=Aspergillus wentii DTO 134E9 TaxID=1073089 RepID=A0A1L9RHN5_ASPWE|nr:uncharacterized protein ASPWEDRAFT_60820 [Aspergillus wentii DTO 134E9]KAI9925772.1 hypothetical protein MW887_005578 [Aspergillus wentii]OJJ34441.1 hypothetical protein ASPWEDRAFT_60820 [Aspergillus wentii DTO 134E9]